MDNDALEEVETIDIDSTTDEEMEKMREKIRETQEENHIFGNLLDMGGTVV